MSTPLNFAALAPLIEVSLKGLDAILHTVTASTDKSHPTVAAIVGILDAITGNVTPAGEIDVAAVLKRIDDIKASVTAGNAEVDTYEHDHFKK